MFAAEKFQIVFSDDMGSIEYLNQAQKMNN